MYEQIKITEREPFTKSLRFELVPVLETRRIIDQKRLLEADHQLSQCCKRIEPLYDCFVKDLIEKALEDSSTRQELELDHLEQQYLQRKKNSRAYREASLHLQKMVRESIIRVLPSGMEQIQQIDSAAFLKQYLPLYIEQSDMEDKDFKLQTLADMNGRASLMHMFAVSRVTILDQTVEKRVLENFEIYCENRKPLQIFLDSENAELLLSGYPSARQYLSVQSFYTCMTMEGIQAYNSMISGLVNEKGIQKKGFNSLAKELNEQNHSDSSDRKVRIPFMKPLYQQILMTQENDCFSKGIQTESDLKALFHELAERYSEEYLSGWITFLQKISLSRIMISGKDLYSFSQITTADFHTIPNILIRRYVREKQSLLERHPLTDTQRKQLLSEIRSATKNVKENGYSVYELERVSSQDLFEGYLSALSKQKDLILSLRRKLDDMGILAPQGTIRGNTASTGLIRQYLDALMQFRKDLDLLYRGQKYGRSNFYDSFAKRYEPFETLNASYNLIRNFITLRMSDIDSSSQVCFGVPSKKEGSWWTGEGKVSKSMHLILRKDGSFYYGTITDGPPVFLDPCKERSSIYEIYTQRKSQDFILQFPKVALKEAKSFFKEHPDQETFLLQTNLQSPLTVKKSLLNRYEKGSHKKATLLSGLCTEEEYQASCEELIAFAISFCRLYQPFQGFHFEFKAPSGYQDYGEFCSYVNTCTSCSQWVSVSESRISELVKDGRLLLFQISHRDMKKPKKNMDSCVKTFLYLFSDQNMQEQIFRLNSQPAVFYRRPALKRNITHPKGSILLNKKDRHGDYLPSAVYRELYEYLNHRCEDLSEEARRYLPNAVYKTAAKDLVKNERYTREQFSLVLTYTKYAKVNQSEVLKNSISQDVSLAMKKGFSTLVVVRGVKELLFCRLYGPDRTVVSEWNLGTIHGIDYSKKLKQLSNDRNYSKMQNWEYDKQIHTVKKNYVNDAASEIIRIAIRHDAVIVIEKIDPNFRNRLSAIDNQLYNLFEKRLEQKLMDFYEKDLINGMEGSLSKPYQLGASRAAGFIQNGIVFRVSNAYISSRCPFTGFLNLFLLHHHSVLQMKNFLIRFQKIEYVPDHKELRYTFDYKDFMDTPDVKTDLVNEQEKTSWTVLVKGEGTVYDKDRKKVVYLSDLTEEPIHLLQSRGEDPSWEISIETLDPDTVEALYRSFCHAIKNPIVRQCKQVPKDYYRSPISGEVLSPLQVNAANLAARFFTWINRKNDNEVPGKTYQ